MVRRSHVGCGLVLFGAVAAIAAALPAMANPKGGQVVGGSATIQGQGTAGVLINQSTQSAIINWQSFNIGAGESTHFNQPSASSTALNRVMGDKNPSSIFGSLSANGRVFLVNPEGFIFGPSASINTAGFLATTHDIKNEDFLAGRYNFNLSGNPKASIVNQGTITVTDAGIAALVAPAVRNDGVIAARLGKVALASANAFTLDLYGDNLIKFALNDEVASQVIDVTTGKPIKSMVENRGRLNADGGTVLLTAVTARALVDSVINNSGVVEARSVGTQNGKIVLGAQTGRSKRASAPTQKVSVSGRLDASGKDEGETGGKVEVTGEAIALAGTIIDVSGYEGGGTVLIGGDVSGGKVNPALATNPKAAHEARPVPTATEVTVDADAIIDASATNSGDGGKIIVWSDGATAFFGAVAARGGANAGDGGFVEVSGREELTFRGNVNVGAPKGIAGTLLLDPLNATIASVAGPGVITVNNIQTALAAGNVIVTTGTTGGEAGNLTVAAPITWGTANTLTLSAFRHIAVNANITNAGGAAINLRADNTGTGIGTVTFAPGIVLSTFGPISIFFNPSVNPAQSGVNGTSYVNPIENFAPNIAGGGDFTSYMLVNSIFDLQNIGNNLSGAYALGKDINAGGFGFAPIGGPATPFIGLLYGNGHVVDGLTITSSATSVGFFAAIGVGGEVRNVGLTNVFITGTASSGATAGLTSANFGTISESYVTGTVVGSGLSVGLLVGYNGYPSGDPGYAILPPGANPGVIERSYAVGTVSSSGLSSGNGRVGGLAGWNLFGSSIIDSYAIASVTFTGAGFDSAAGGLVGENHDVITRSYAAGSVSGGTVQGGLVGTITLNSVVTDSYWDTQTSGQPTSAAGIGLTTAQLKSGLPAGFSPTVWGLSGGVNDGYPHLLWQSAPAPVVTTLPPQQPNLPQDPFPTGQIAQLSTASYSYVSIKTQQQTTVSYSVPLATVGGRTFAPISQLDASQYGGDTTALNDWAETCKATVYTMIARAAGETGATIAQFWDPELGATAAGLPTNVSLGARNSMDSRAVVTLLNSGKPVIIGGTVNRAAGGEEAHWMLATSMTTDGKIVANDPWTGQQVLIDPQTNRVVSPSNYALPSFKGTTFQSVSIQ